MQVTKINQEPHRNGQDKEKVCLEDVKHLITVRSKALADQLHPIYIENSSGLLNTSPPPNRLEEYPAPPELMGSG